MKDQLRRSVPGRNRRISRRSALPSSRARRSSRSCAGTMGCTLVSPERTSRGEVWQPPDPLSSVVLTGVAQRRGSCSILAARSGAEVDHRLPATETEQGHQLASLVLYFDILPEEGMGMQCRFPARGCPGRRLARSRCRRPGSRASRLARRPPRVDQRRSSGAGRFEAASSASVSAGP